MQNPKEFIITRLALQEMLKRNHSGKRKMTPDEIGVNTEELKSTGNGNYRGKYGRYFLIMSISLRESWLFDQNLSQCTFLTYGS